MQLLSMFLTFATIVAPVFAPPATGWVQQPPDPRHTSVTTWVLQPGQMFMFQVTPFAGKTEDQRSLFEKAFNGGQIPLRIESEGTVTLCNGLVADRITIISTRGTGTHTEHVFVAYSGKLYDVSYVYITPQPLPEAQTALASMCPSAK